MNPPPAELLLPEKILMEMTAEASARAPREACGLLAGRGKRVTTHFPIANQLASPQRFRMEPHEQLRAFVSMDRSDLELLAIWHSHPAGPPVPSETDVREFYYPEALAVIGVAEGAGWTFRAFCVTGKLVCEVVLRPVELSG